MKVFARAVVVVSALIIVGCAGTSSNVKSQYQLIDDEKLQLMISTPASASEEAVSIFRERLKLQLTNSALLAEESDKSAKVIEVTVTNYYMRHGATRALVGIMAGADNIQSTIKVKDPVSGVVLSEFSVESTNPTAMFTSRGLIEEHADEIVQTLKKPSVNGTNG